jgi:hypothetical protein
MALPSLLALARRDHLLGDLPPELDVAIVERHELARLPVPEDGERA